MKKHISDENTQLEFNFDNNPDHNIYKNSNNVIELNSHLENRNKNNRNKEIDRIISLSDHLYK